MKIEYNRMDLNRFNTIVTSGDAYDHTFTTPKLRWRVRFRNWLQRVIMLHRNGYGWIFTRKQANKALIKMLNVKVEK